MTHWNNEDAGDLRMQHDADHSACLAERDEEECARAFAEYEALWAKWKAADTDNAAFYAVISCEECGGPMNATNCHEGPHSWHCGCW